MNKKVEEIGKLLANALSRCGEGHELAEIRANIRTTINKLNNISMKNQRRQTIAQNMIELAKKKQSDWWESIKKGLETPKLEIKKENDGKSDQIIE